MFRRYIFGRPAANAAGNGSREEPPILPEEGLSLHQHHRQQPPQEQSPQAQPSQTQPPQEQPPHASSVLLLPGGILPDVESENRQASSGIQGSPRKPSKPSLRLDDNSSFSQQETGPPSPASPDLPNPLPWMGLEVDDESQVQLSSMLGQFEISHGDLSWPAAVMTTDGSSSEVQALPTRDTNSPNERPRLPLSYSWYDGPGISTSTSTSSSPNNSIPTTSTLMEDVHLSGTQYSLPSPPLPLSSTPSHSAIGVPTRLPPIMEPDDDVDLMPMELEVDEVYCSTRGGGSVGGYGIASGGGGGGGDDDEATRMLEDVLSLRRASLPGTGGSGSRHGLLRYQKAGEVALRCANVVRSRPRMRKRMNRHKTKPRSDSVASSAASSVGSYASAPVVGLPMPAAS